jgi:hypothetical protein
MRNIINDLPPEIHAEIDSMVSAQASGSAIHRMLKDKYSTLISVPALPTVLKYIRKKNEEDKRAGSSVLSPAAVSQFALGLSELARVADQARTKNEPNFSKIRILEGLVGKCILRIQSIEDAATKTTKIFPGNEQAMVKYISEIRGIIESVIKLSTDLKQDDQEILQLIRAESQAFLKIVKSVVLDVCPEKYELFKLKLKEGLKTKSVELGIEDSTKYEHRPPTDAEVLTAVGTLPEMSASPSIDVKINENIKQHIETVEKLNNESLCKEGSVEEAGTAPDVETVAETMVNDTEE